MKNGLIIGIVGVVVILSLVLFFQSQDNQLTGKTTLTKEVVEMYHSPTCECCNNYKRYLESNGFDVKSIETEDMYAIKDSFSVPIGMHSCHTLRVGNYFVEGHVPIEAIQQLLDEQPEVDGIALPGMPSGSPGMGGIKTQPFIIYSVSDGSINEFRIL